MGQELTNVPQKQSPAVRLSQNVTVRALQEANFRKTSDSLPVRIEGTFDFPKIWEMKQATSESSVQAFIEFELNLLAEKVNVSGNLTDGQIQAIAQAIVTDYPNETIADFKICFTNAANGRYGKIWKLDGIEVGVWVGLYLEDKYTVHENQWNKEKDHYKNQVFEAAKSGSDWLKLWKEAVDEADRLGGVKTESQNITFLNNLRAMSPEETKEKGQEKAKKELYPSSSKAEIEKHQRHLAYIRANYDARTGEPIKGVWVKESEWKPKEV